VTDFLGLPALPPIDAHATAVALIHAMRPLDAQRAFLETRAGDVAAWLDEMLAPLAPTVLDARDRQRWIAGLERRG